MQQHGYTIFPEHQLPLLVSDGSIRDTVRECVKQCRLSIHLIGNQYGAIPEEEKNSVDDLQLQIATETSQESPFSVLIWIRPQLQTKDKRQVKLIEILRNKAPGNKQIELIEVELEDFKTIILDKLKEIEKPPKMTIEPSELVRIYLMYDLLDKDTVKSLNDSLFNKGLEVMHPLFRGEERTLREMHQDNLSLCDATMIYYDHGDELWLNTKLNDLRKAPGFPYYKPKRAKAVYVSGEKTEHKLSFNTREEAIIRHFANYSDAVLAPFLVKLQNGNSDRQ